MSFVDIIVFFDDRFYRINLVRNSHIDPEDEDILFYDLAVPFYESWSEMIQDAERTQEERVSAFSTCLAAEYIVRILDDFLWYSYFLEDDEEDYN